MVELWSASSSHVARPDQALVAHPGLMTAVAYHLRLGRRVDLFAGADVEYALITESFAIDGLGQVATTPAFYLSLFTGASLNLL